MSPFRESHGYFPTQSHAFQHVHKKGSLKHLNSSFSDSENVSEPLGNTNLKWWTFFFSDTYLKTTMYLFPAATCLYNNHNTDVWKHSRFLVFCLLYSIVLKSLGLDRGWFENSLLLKNFKVYINYLGLSKLIYIILN